MELPATLTSLADTPGSQLHNDLPPLLALRAFEAVARHLSFVNAARELSLTQSALSHQVQKLEQHLDCRLFVRRTRAIELTERGDLYYQQVRPALETIAEATRQIRGVDLQPKVLRIGLLASFATLWLAQRLSGFMVENPDIHVELVPAYQLADVAGGEVELSIRYGKGNWPNVKAQLLMTERLSPVCSPDFKANWLSAQAAGKGRRLAPGPLLMSQANIQFEWQDWTRKHHINIDSIPSIMLHDYNIVVEAAVSGQGIAMGRHRLIGRRLQDATLVELLPDAAYEADIGYWLVTPSNQYASPAAQRFSEWLTKLCIEHG